MSEDNCTNCGRFMRPKKARSGEMPGVTRGSRGQCAVCLQRVARAAKRENAYHLPQIGPKARFGSVFATDADRARVGYMVAARFPGDRDMLAMLGLVAS